MVWLDPADAVGPPLAGGGVDPPLFTVIVTVAVPVAPWLSVTVSWITYVPVTRFEMVGVAYCPFTMLNDDGPLIFCQL